MYLFYFISSYLYSCIYALLLLTIANFKSIYQAFFSALNSSVKNLKIIKIANNSLKISVYN